MRERRHALRRAGTDSMSRWSQRTLLVSLLIIMGLAWALPANQIAWSSEFRFVVEDLPDNSAAWLPREVVIHTETELTGGLVFILVNPTARTHVFLAEGLFEQEASESGEAATKPLRVTVAPEETVRTLLSTMHIEKVHAGKGGTAEEYRFFCPLHRGDADASGTIRMVHLGGTIRMVQ